HRQPAAASSLGAPAGRDDHEESHLCRWRHSSLLREPTAPGERERRYVTDRVPTLPPAGATIAGQTSRHSSHRCYAVMGVLVRPLLRLRMRPVRTPWHQRSWSPSRAGTATDQGSKAFCAGWYVVAASGKKIDAD